MKSVCLLALCLPSIVLAQQPWTETFNSSTYGSYVRTALSVDSVTNEWSADYTITVKHLNVNQGQIQQPYVLTLLVTQSGVKFKEIRVTTNTDLSGNNNTDNQSPLSYCTLVIRPESTAQDSIALFRKGILLQGSTAPLVIGFGDAGIGQFGDSTTPGEITASGVATLLVRSQIGSGNAWGAIRANGSGQFGRPASVAGIVANGTNGWRGSVISDNGQIDTFRAPNGTISGFFGYRAVYLRQDFYWLDRSNESQRFRRDT
jgi:hypothetical protein